MLSKIWVWDPGSEIRKKPIPDPGSRGQKCTGSQTRIRNTACIKGKMFRFNFGGPLCFWPLALKLKSHIPVFKLNIFPFSFSPPKNAFEHFTNETKSNY
jgi:hypothetical protein